MEDENALPMYRWKEKMVEHLCVSERKKICVDIWEKIKYSEGLVEQRVGKISCCRYVSVRNKYFSKS
jgi:hypothetical protein